MTSQPITFFIDRCLGSKRIAEALRRTGINIEIHSDHFAPGAPDVEWLPEVGKRGSQTLLEDLKRLLSTDNIDNEINSENQ